MGDPFDVDDAFEVFSGLKPDGPGAGNDTERSEQKPPQSTVDSMNSSQQAADKENTLCVLQIRSGLLTERFRTRIEAVLREELAWRKPGEIDGTLQLVGYLGGGFCIDRSPTPDSYPLRFLPEGRVVEFSSTHSENSIRVEKVDKKDSGRGMKRKISAHERAFRGRYYDKSRVDNLERFSDLKHGVLSKDLCEALGIGENDEPPWNTTWCNSNPPLPGQQRVVENPREGPVQISSYSDFRFAV